MDRLARRRCTSRTSRRSSLSKNIAWQAGRGGKGILIIARRESARRRPFAFRSHYGRDSQEPRGDLDRLTHAPRVATGARRRS